MIFVQPKNNKKDVVSILVNSIVVSMFVVVVVVVLLLLLCFIFDDLSLHWNFHIFGYHNHNNNQQQNRFFIPQQQSAVVVVPFTILYVVEAFIVVQQQVYNGRTKHQIRQTTTTTWDKDKFNNKNSVVVLNMIKNLHDDEIITPTFTSDVENQHVLLLSLQYYGDHNEKGMVVEQTNQTLSSSVIESVEKKRRNSSFSKINKHVWNWKDSVLGDGRDFFIPKPKTIIALQNYIMKEMNHRWCTTMNHRTVQVQECIIISNCARFEIMLVVHSYYNINNSSTTTMIMKNDDSRNNNNNNPPNDDDNDDVERKSMREKKKQQEQQYIIEFVSKLFISQINSYQRSKKKNIYLNQLQTPFDLPNMIDQDAFIEQQQHNTGINSDFVSNQQQSMELYHQWNVYNTISDIIQHLCLISGGMAVRPRRLDRPVIFQPFSSRDAHILLQLKRTYDIAISSSLSSSQSSNNQLTRKMNKSAPPNMNQQFIPNKKIIDATKLYSSRNKQQAYDDDNKNDEDTFARTSTTTTSSSSSSSSIIPVLLRYSIQAGKAVRNPNIVPSINRLRQYGTGNSKYDLYPPKDIVETVTKDAIKYGIDPVIQECVEYFQVIHYKSIILHFREKAFAFAFDDPSLLLIKQSLHQPTIQLRQGTNVDENEFFRNLTNQLNELKKEKNTKKVMS